MRQREHRVIPNYYTLMYNCTCLHIVVKDDLVGMNAQAPSLGLPVAVDVPRAGKADHLKGYDII